MGPTPMGATPMGSTPKSAQKAYEVKNFHEFTEVPNDEGNKRISLVSIVSIIFENKVFLVKIGPKLYMWAMDFIKHYLG